MKLRMEHLRLPAGFPVPLWFLLLSCSLAAPSAAAETIILKSGRRIVASSVVEEGDKVVYETAVGRIAIPKSLVDRVEAGGTPRPRRAEAVNEQAAEELSGRIEAPRTDSEAIIRGNAVDEERLRLLASNAARGDLERQNAVNAHLIAAAFEAKAKQFAAAGRWAEEAVRLSGRDLNALLVASQIDIARQQYSEALDHLYVASTVNPNSPDVLTLQGYAHYYAEGPERALRFWNQALAIRPDDRLRQRMEQVQREAAVEGSFQQAESGNFVLSWEGSEVSRSFSREVLESLERQYRELERSLDYTPREPIAVILYTTQQFADVTQSPSWAGAINDGKVRVPVQGLSSMTPGLEQVLKHEMVHSFVHRIAEGRCPTWFNEGLAQMESEEDLGQYGAALARLYSQSRQVPIMRLEGSFQRLTSSEAALAYAESHAAVEMLRDRYGAYQLPTLLRSLGSGKTMEQALREVLRMTYEDLETELAQYLTRRFGR
jgi:tetratricopeptide (TPR) repeat protein